MKDKITKYCCDVCGKEVEKEELKSYQIPATYYFDREILTHGVWIDICSECEESLKEIIRKNFAEINDIWCWGKEVKKVIYKEVNKNDC